MLIKAPTLLCPSEILKFHIKAVDYSFYFLRNHQFIMTNPLRKSLIDKSCFSMVNTWRLFLIGWEREIISVKISKMRNYYSYTLMYSNCCPHFHCYCLNFLAYVHPAMFKFLWCWQVLAVTAYSLNQSKKSQGVMWVPVYQKTNWVRKVEIFVRDELTE